jgi:hypothetical protein
MKNTVNVSSRFETSRTGVLLKQREALARPTRPVASPLVDHPPRGGPNQPGARLRGDPVARPVHGCREQRLLDGVLRSVEVAGPASEHTEDLRRQLAQQVLDIARHVQRSPPAVWSHDSISATSDGALSITCRT